MEHTQDRWLKLEVVGTGSGSEALLVAIRDEVWFPHHEVEFHMLELIRGTLTSYNTGKID